MGSKATPKAIHICNLHKPTHNSQIEKEYVLPTLTEKVEEKHENLTMVINNAGFGA